MNNIKGFKKPSGSYHKMRLFSNPKFFFLFILGTAVSFVLVTVIFQSDFIYAFPFPFRKLKTTEVVDSYYVNRTGKHCDLHFGWGEMCPKLYTELGGRCDLINGTFDCPDIRNKTKSTQRQAQLVMTRMLRTFDLLAQKHNIFYWIAHGTLLGAVRHQGFIPWDHDIDIHVPLDDYVKFFQVAAKELPDDIFFQNCISDPGVRPNYQEIVDNNLHIHSTVGVYQRRWNPRLRDVNSCYRYCLAHNCTWHDGLLVDIFVFPHVRSSFYPLKQMIFEGFLFPIPNNWKGELTSEYGEDCFQFPKEPVLDDTRMDPIHGCEKLT